MTIILRRAYFFCFFFVFRTVRDTLIQNKVPLHHYVTFTLQSDQFTHPAQSGKFEVEEISLGTQRIEDYMTVLANQLNSNEAFQPGSTFQADLTVIQCTKKGGKGKFTLGKRAISDVTRQKRSVIEIKNIDTLCCARAIFVTKAWLHKDDSRDAKRHYYKVTHREAYQARMARKLHEDAGVRLGPCGHEAPEKCQAYLSPDYQLKVMAMSFPYMVTYQGPPAPLIIRLLQFEDHYHGCRSNMGFLERSYFCDECNRGYSNDDFRHHPCEGRLCPACKQKECGPKRGSPSLSCETCHQSSTMRRVYNIIEPTKFARNSNDAPSVARNSIQPIRKNLTARKKSMS